MKNTKRSINLKVVFGYLLISAIAVIAVWFIYGQIVTISETSDRGNLNNQKLFLVSEAATNLYVAESISRDIIQNQNASELPRFKSQIDTIQSIIDSLKGLSFNTEIGIEIDSINKLLHLKSKNIEELLVLRQEATTESYYTKVIDNLQEIDDVFEDENYEYQLRNLRPEAREAIIGLIEYSKQSRAEELTQRTADSLVNALKFVLNNLEAQERSMMLSINEKENELLENDRIISNQLRDLRAAIEQEEIQKSIDQVNESQAFLENTSLIIGGLGIVSVLTILIFGIMIFKDTSKSQRYRQELEASKNYTESLLKSREQIMAAVTHDLRSPLNTVIGYSDLLNNSELTEKQKHYLENLRTSSDYILRLVNDLLDLSKLEAGKMNVSNVRFRLSSIIEESIKNAIPQGNEKELKIQVQIDEKLKGDIVSDPFRLQQILTNLISNAYKFTEKGEIRVSASIKKIKKVPNMLYIKVHDTGIGISKEQQKTVFNEFSQANKDIEKLYGGYGLGLAITKKLVTLLNGGIFMESKLKVGSTFTFYLPIEFSKNNTSLEVKAKEKHPEKPSFKGKNILVVDDESAQLTLTSEILKGIGATVETALSASQALKKVKQNEFDFILTDIQMPEMNGFEFLNHIKSDKATSGIPVIALSGNTDLSPAEFTAKGFHAKLTKPYKAQDLFSVLKNNTTIHFKEERKTTTSTKLYDLEDIHLFTEGDSKSLKVILQAFIQSSKINVSYLEEALHSENIEAVSTTAHKMLPMVRQLKINSCIPYLKKLEHISYKELALIQKEFPEFNKKLKLVLSELEQEITT